MLLFNFVQNCELLHISWNAISTINSSSTNVRFDVANKRVYSSSVYTCTRINIKEDNIPPFFKTVKNSLCIFVFSFILRMSRKRISKHVIPIIVISLSHNFFHILQGSYIGCVWTTGSWYRLNQCVLRPIKNTFTLINFWNIMAWRTSY